MAEGGMPVTGTGPWAQIPVPGDAQWADRMARQFLAAMDDEGVMDVHAAWDAVAEAMGGYLNARGQR